MSEAGAGAAIEEQLLQVAGAVEERVDAEIQRLDDMHDDELEVLRQRRLQALKKAQLQQQEWRSQGHGVYSEIADEKEFFAVCKSSPRVVCHFFRDTTPRCLIVDGHLSSLAPRHMETRFVRICVMRALFVCTRLRVHTLPTVAVVTGGSVSDYVVGFDDFGGRDDFTTAQMEHRLARAGALFASKCTAPSGAPSQGAPCTTITHAPKKTVRSHTYSDSDSD